VDLGIQRVHQEIQISEEMVGCSLVCECGRNDLWTPVTNIVDFAKFSINCHFERSGTKNDGFSIAIGHWNEMREQTHLILLRNTFFNIMEIIGSRFFGFFSIRKTVTYPYPNTDGNFHSFVVSIIACAPL
jgi:hypothetical protein